MAYVKRQKVPKKWPVARKGNHYSIKPKGHFEEGLPVLVAIRDVLKFANKRKDVKKAINQGSLKLNGKVMKDEKRSMTLFDVLEIVPSNEYYRLGLAESGKFKIEKIGKKEANTKITKIANKKILKGGKVQLNLLDGRNILASKGQEKFKTNNSVVVNLEENKIEDYLEFGKGKEVFVIGGKHSGKKGKITELEEGHEIVEIETENKNKINVLTKHLIVTK